MSKIQDTINDLAQGLYKADVIDKKTLKNLTDVKRQLRLPVDDN